MDKYDTVLDIIGHPDRYTPDRLAEILADRETREIYNRLCMAASCVASDSIPRPDVDDEWSGFSSRHSMTPRHRRRWPRRAAARAAVIALISLSSLAVAAGIIIGISHVRGLTPHDGNSKTSAKHSEVMAEAAEDSPLPADSLPAMSAGSVLFEDQPLEAVMHAVGKAYGVEVRFNSRETASLHIYYRLDPSLPLDEILSQLNTFEQINIRHAGNRLIID